MHGQTSHMNCQTTPIRDLPMEDSPPDLKRPGRPSLLPSIDDPGGSRRSESPMSDMDLDDPLCGAEGLQPSRRPRCGSLVLRCVDCSGVVLVVYGRGAVPLRLRLTGLTRRSNGVALTTCKRCLCRTRNCCDARPRPFRGQYSFVQSPTTQSTVWNASDFVRAAAFVLEEPVALMMAGRVSLHIDWERVAKTLGVRDCAVSIDVSQLAHGAAQAVVLPHLAGNWV